jgi:hypothetical protein
MVVPCRAAPRPPLKSRGFRRFHPDADRILAYPHNRGETAQRSSASPGVFPACPESEILESAGLGWCGPWLPPATTMNIDEKDRVIFLVSSSPSSIFAQAGPLASPHVCGSRRALRDLTRGSPPGEPPGRENRTFGVVPPCRHADESWSSCSPARSLPNHENVNRISLLVRSS